MCLAYPRISERAFAYRLGLVLILPHELLVDTAHLEEEVSHQSTLPGVHVSYHH